MRPCNTEITREFDIDIPLRIHISYDKIKLIMYMRVVTATSDMYADSFGFTENEVMTSLEEYGLSDRFSDVKKWYDGFIFGSHRDIYSPWSITYFPKEKQLRPYWASTSSNGLINKLIRTGTPEIKEMMERLMNGENIVVNFDEQIVFDQLGRNEASIWSLLLASGYMKTDSVEYRGTTLEPWYHLSITNMETVDKALRQIDEKQYDAELLVKGIAGSPAVDDDNKIRSYWENVMEQADECMYKQKSEHKHRAGGSQERR